MLSQESPEIYEANTHIHIEPCIALRIHAAVRHSPTFYFDANQHIFSGVHHPGYIVCLGGCGKHHIALTLLCTALTLTPRSTDEAFKFSSHQAFKLSSLQVKPPSLRFSWAYRHCKNENLLEGWDGVQTNCITHILHPYRKRKIVKVTAGQHTPQLSISSSSVQPSKDLISIQTDLCTPTMPAT